MAPAHSLPDDDWLVACRQATATIRGALEMRSTVGERAEETGALGGGGDRTLMIDSEAEAAVFAELKTLYDGGKRFTVVSEERGGADFGDSELRVVVDPIDGSLNAKRGLAHHALSVAVADGPTVADVVFGYVYDFGTREEWVARRGAGAFLNGARLDPERDERRVRDGRLEVVAIESADPRWVAASMDGLLGAAYRLRAMGAIAVSLCQVAAARVDGMVSLRSCRSFDAAAGALIVAEAGGQVAFPRFDEPLAAPLDLLPHSPVVAARSPEALELLKTIPG